MQKSSTHSHSIIQSTPEQVALAARNWFVSIAIMSILQRDRCLVALSGGSTPKRLYQLLAELPEGLIDWSRVHLFWGDERNVPSDHPDSNYRMVREALLDRIVGEKPVVHAIPTDGSTPCEAANNYERTMRSIAGSSPFVFDIVLLGLGDDAHTASLFPETAALKVTNRWAIENEVPKLNTTRISLTAPILNSSRNTAFLVCGESKQWALGKIHSAERNATLYPAQLIRPIGDLWWFLDEAASNIE